MIRLDTHEDGLWVVTIDRAEKANSLTREMLEELTQVAERAQEARALVLTGSGKVFSAGMDLDAAKSGLATDGVWERLSGALVALPCLTIAALNGTVAGGAIGMVLACDLRIAVPGVKLFYPVMQRGFLPQPSDPARLAALAGPSRARMILMAGEKIEAQTAQGWGLIDRIVDTDPVAEARALAADVLAATPEHAAAIKAMCRG
ncbi:MAG: enoyl-CoA hydratase/isomerase family protein [Rhodobacteraceae bacterium]|jgi:enoyl-CoA hydratase/carnithine racemase|nr:enoyl-CoA hydratase/isomerase family protein [Paracoccaceae bacterium]